MTARRMRLGLSIRGHGYHPAAWRHPDVPADGTLHVEHYVQSAQIAERGKLDMIFFADGAGIRQGDHPRGSLARTGRDMVELEPMTLLPALAMVTRHVGLVTTASTTYNEPYNLARKFATLGPDQQGPRRLERGGVMVGARSAELRAGDDAGLRHALRPIRRVRRGGQGTVGQLGRRRASARQGGRPVFRRSEDACAGSSRAVLQGARSAQCRLHAAGPSGDRAGRRVGARPRAGRRDRRGHLCDQRLARGRARLLRRREGADGEIRPCARRSQDHAGALSGRRPHARGSAGEVRRAAGVDRPAGRPGLALQRVRRSVGLSAGRAGARRRAGQPGAPQRERPARRADETGEAHDSRTVPPGRPHRLRADRHARRCRRCHAGVVRSGGLRWLQHHASNPARRR